MTFVSSVSSYPDVTPDTHLFLVTLSCRPVTFVSSVSSYPDSTPEELSASDVCIICF